jgi:hypothetical protein
VKRRAGGWVFSLAPPPPIAVGQEPSSIAIGDLNGEGKTDIVTADLEDNDVSILLTK